MLHSAAWSQPPHDGLEDPVSADCSAVQNVAGTIPGVSLPTHTLLCCTGRQPLRALQSYGADNVTSVNATSVMILGPIRVNIPIRDGRTGAPGERGLADLWDKLDGTQQQWSSLASCQQACRGASPCPM